MKTQYSIIILFVITLQSFSQNETKQSFGIQVGVSSANTYQLGSLSTGYYTLEGEGPCVNLNYKHDIVNSRFRISPVFQIGFYSDDSGIQEKYTATSMMLNLECDAIRYKSFNVMLQLGGGVNTGSGTILQNPIGYTHVGYSFGLGFRYEPINSPISIILQPISIQRGINGSESSDVMSALLGFDINF